MRVTSLPMRVKQKQKLSLPGIVYCSLILLTSCQPASTAKSEIFPFLFPQEQHDFRFVDLGVAQDSIKERELIEPSHEDLLGLAYDFRSPDSQTLIHVEYYYPEGREENKLKSILANIRFSDPLQCELLYNNCQRLFNRRYGTSVSGEYGKESWQEARAEGILEAHLILSESQTVLSVNILLVPGQSFP